MSPSFNEFKKQIEQFKLEIQSLDPSKDIGVEIDNRYYNQTRTKLGRKLYLLTKNFLNAPSLTPEEKGKILKEYIEIWGDNKCQLRIEDTEYAAAYKNSSFGKYRGPYNPDCPMTGGFNLSDAHLIGCGDNLVFIHVNFNNAKFLDVSWIYSHFENCSMNSIKTTEDTNLNQCQFIKCAMNSNDLTHTQLCEVYIEYCSIIDTKLPQDIDPYECIDKLKAPYPLFLQHLKVPSKKLTPMSVANALWLSDKDSATTKASKLQFSLWAKKNELSITIDEVEKCLALTYDMKT